jgi:hypothetical protein
MAPNCSLRGEFAIEVKIPKVAESMPRPGAAKWTALFTLNHPPGIIDAACYPNYNTSFSGSVWQIGTPGTGNITTTAYLNKAAFVDPPAYTGRHRTLGSAGIVCSAQRGCGHQRAQRVRIRRKSQGWHAASGARAGDRQRRSAGTGEDPGKLPVADHGAERLGTAVQLVAAPNGN